MDGDGAVEIVVGNKEETVYSLSGSDGSVEWQQTVDSDVYGSPAVADVDGDGAMEVVGDHNYHVRVLDQQYTLTVEVKDDGGASIGCQVNLNPPNSDFGDGSTYTYPGGTSVTATAKPCTGYRFDHWELDGVDVGSSATYTLTMDDDHTLRAVYKEEVRHRPTPGPSPRYNLSLAGFPSFFAYLAGLTDRLENSDILEEFEGLAPEDRTTYLVVLGGPDVFPYDWSQRGVRFIRVRGVYSAVSVLGERYEAEFGRLDYCVLALEPGSMVVRVAGVTRYGTRAGLMWLMDHPDAFSEGNNVLLRWMDSDGDGEVDPWEVARLSSW